MTAINKKIILFVVFCLSIFLITFHFTDTPKVWIDEGIFTNVAQNVALHGFLGIQTSPDKYFSLGPILTANYPVIYPVAASIYVFGTGIFQARLPMLLYMFILVVLFFLFVKEKYGFNEAILSVLMLISFSPFYGNGRPVQGEVPGLVFFVLGSLLLLLLERKGFVSKTYALFAGLSFGFSAATKPIYLILLVPSFCVAFVVWFKKIQNNKVTAIFGLSFLLPLVFWFFINFPTKELMLQIIPTVLNQSGSSLPLVKTVTSNVLKFVRESTPVLFILILISIVVSFGLKIYKDKLSNFRQTVSISEFVILVFIILNWLSFLRGPGWYRYFFPAHALLYLLFPAAILSFVNVIKNKILKKIFVAIPVILIILQFYHLIFLSQTSFIVKRERNNELAEEMAKLDPAKKMLFYNSVETIVFYKSSNYNQYLSMAGLFEAGDREAILRPKADYILITHYKNYDYPLPCYKEKIIDRYSLFTKIPLCAK